MNDSADNPSGLTKKKKRRVHKRTLAIVFCFVIVPWILIAIPGTPSGGSGTTGMNVSYTRHGWPFVHFRTTHVDVYGTWVNGKFTLGPPPPGTDLDKLAQKFAIQRELLNPNDLELDLRFYRDSGASGWGKQTGFWTEGRFWPIFEKGRYFSPVYLSIFLNLSLVISAALVLAAFVELRIRKHRRLAIFSLKTLLIGTTAFAFVIAWNVREYRESKKTAKLIQSLANYEDDNGIELYCFTHEETRFPLVVSQLLNHGKHVWGVTPFFFHTKTGEVELSLDKHLDPEKFSQVKKDVIDSGFEIFLDVCDFDVQRKNMLQQFSGANLTTLVIDFDSTDWVYQAIGDLEETPVWEEAKKLANLKLDLQLDLPNLRVLELELDSTLDQVDQLRVFVGSPLLEDVRISNLSKEGAEFILKTRDKWPKAMDLNFRDGVPEELQEQFETEFAEPPDGLWSIIPVVG
ncbi:MAG: hypothetical protein AB8B55_20365 [Mariniblastus sp.]